MFIFDTDTTTINKSEKGNITCGNDLFRTMSKGALDMFSVKYAGKKYPDNFTKEEICERLFNTVKDIFREDAVPVTKKWGRSLDLFIGTEPEEKNEHAVMFSRAITELIEEGKKKSSQKTICSKAIEIGIYDVKPSKRSIKEIFKEHRSTLHDLGWVKPQ